MPKQQKLSLRERAAEILSTTFPDWDITAEDIYPVTGFWKRVDVYRWEAYFHLKKVYSNGNRIPMSIGCWENLTEFVKLASKYGCEFDSKCTEVSPNYGPKEVNNG